MRSRRNLTIISLLLLALGLVTLTRAKVSSSELRQRYLLLSDVQFILDLIPPPPLDDSAEHQAELDLVKRIEQNASAETLNRARSEFRLGLSLFGSVLGPWFVKERLPETWSLFKNVQGGTNPVIIGVKEKYRRLRPPASDSAIEPLDRASFDALSYPSGHAFYGTLFALILAELAPDKSDEISRTGQEIGWHRIVAGMHHPSDVTAGRILAKITFIALKQSDQFKADLAKAKAEVEMVRGHFD